MLSSFIALLQRKAFLAQYKYNDKLANVTPELEMFPLWEQELNSHIIYLNSHHNRINNIFRIA
jgi:hypothetical protein